MELLVAKKPRNIRVCKKVRKLPKRATCCRVNCCR